MTCCAGPSGTSVVFLLGLSRQRLKVAEPPQPGERRVALEREGTTAYLKFGYHAPAATDPDFFPMLVLDAVLTGAKGLNLWSSFRVAPPQRKSRLYTALFERGLASQVNGALLATADPYLYTLSFTATEGVRLPVLEEAVFAALEPVAAGGIDDGEVARAKRQLRARLVFEDDSVTQRRPSARLLRNRRRAGLLPEAAGVHRRRDRRPGARRRPAPPAAEPADGRFVPAAGVALMAATLAQGLSPVREELANGAVILVQETSMTPAVTISATFHAGSVFDPPERPGLAYLTGRVLDRGTATRSAAVLADELDDRGVSLRVSTNRQALTVSCTCLSEDFDDILTIMVDVARNPTFPEGEIEKRRSEALTVLRQNEDNPAARAVEGVLELLYTKEHPYGRPLEGHRGRRRAGHACRHPGVPRAPSATRGSVGRHRRRHRRRPCAQLRVCRARWLARSRAGAGRPARAPSERQPSRAPDCDAWQAAD